MCIDIEGRTFYFCSAGCKTKFAADPAKYLGVAAANAHVQVPAPCVDRSACRHDLHVPDAPGGPAGSSGQLPEVRHGARAARCRRSTTSENPELARFPAALLVDAAADDRRHRCWRCSATGCSWFDAGDAELDRAACCRCRSCCGPAGRSSCAASQSIVHRSPNMWTLIGLGTGGGVRLQRRRDRRAAACSRARSCRWAASRVYFEAAAVIISLTCSARCSS